MRKEAPKPELEHCMVSMGTWVPTMFWAGPSFTTKNANMETTKVRCRRDSKGSGFHLLLTLIMQRENLI